MNNLSWFLYFTEIAPNMGGILHLLGILIGIGWVMFHVFTVQDEYPLAHIINEQKFFLKPLLLALTLVVFSGLVPSKETIYLIAGSEAGEAVVTSDTGQEILNDIQTIIKQQIKSTVD